MPPASCDQCRDVGTGLKLVSYKAARSDGGERKTAAKAVTHYRGRGNTVLGTEQRSLPLLGRGRHFPRDWNCLFSVRSYHMQAGHEPIMERQPHVAPNGLLAAYDNSRIAGASLSNPCSTAGITYVRRERYTTTEGKHKSCFYREASLNGCSHSLTWFSPQKLGRWRIASGILPTRLNSKILFKPTPETLAYPLCYVQLMKTRLFPCATGFLTSQQCIHAHSDLV